MESRLADGQLLLEFEIIPRRKAGADFSMAAHPDNLTRNQYVERMGSWDAFDYIWWLIARFQDVLPYEENRVKLTPNRENRTGYINASHISAAVGSAQRFYIAAQGPLPSTVADFWQMIWQCDVYVVVMLADTSSSSNSGQQTPALNTKSVTSLRSHVSNSSMNGYSGFIYWPQRDMASLEFGEVNFALVTTWNTLPSLIFLAFWIVQNHAACWQAVGTPIYHQAGCNTFANRPAT